MPDGGGHPQAAFRVGPNAILQLVEPVDQMLGQGVMAQLLDLCRVPLPDGSAMVPEEDVGRVHHTLWQVFPDQAQALSERAGQATACYIRSHRIPIGARLALRVMPRALGEKMLVRAIEKHAWTFCGSGTLKAVRREGEVHFVIHENPLADTQARPPHPCYWHSAVFAELFSSLLGWRYHCEEVSCCGCGADLCRFVLRRQKSHGHFKGLRL